MIVCGMTYEQYLEAEAAADIKHEWLRGEVFAMAGGTPTHARLAAAIIGALSRVLGDRPCEVFTSDLRVRVEATDLSTYPDVTVVCGELLHSEVDVNAVINPTLIGLGQRASARGLRTQRRGRVGAPRGWARGVAELAIDRRRAARDGRDLSRSPRARMSRAKSSNHTCIQARTGDHSERMLVSFSGGV